MARLGIELETLGFKYNTITMRYQQRWLKSYSNLNLNGINRVTSVRQVVHLADVVIEATKTGIILHERYIRF